MCWRVFIEVACAIFAVPEVANPGLFDGFTSIDREEHPIDKGIVGMFLHLLDKFLEVF